VAILPAPGQHGESHDRLAGRLAAAGYVVVALDPLPTTPLGELADLVGSLTDAPRPLTLVGWDVRSLEELQIALAARGLPTAIASAGATTAEILDVLERVQA
jgi:hypothetical protein